MKPWCLVLGLAVLTAVLPVAADDRKVKDEDRLPPTDVQDFVLLTDARPVLVHLHVRIDGEPFRAVWYDFMQDLFEWLDVNGDGVLDQDELARAPSAELLMARGALGFGLPVEKVTARALAEKNKGRKVTGADLAANYRQNGLAPLQVRFGPTPVTLPPNQGQLPGQASPGLRREPQRREPSSGIAVARATFTLLDTDKTDKLTREKLAAASTALLKADDDDDEIVTTRELGSYAAAHRLAMVPNVDPVILVHPDESADELVRGLLARYGPKTDKPADRKLTQKDLGVDGATFALLDADKDGKLDKEELARFARRPPDLELTVRLSAKGTAAQVELNTKDGRSPLAANVKAKDGAVTVDLGSVTVQMRTGDAAVRPPGLERLIRTPGVFDFLDEKKGQLVEADTLDPEAGIFRGHFRLIDRDGKGKVTKNELVAYVQKMGDLQARATAACISLVFIEDGQGLFDFLDADHDGRLIAHEMLKAPALLARLDRDGKGYLTPSDVPGRCQLLVRRGPAAGPGYSALGYKGGYLYPGTEVGSGEDDRPPPPEPKAGPLWFRKMDRNGDGFVSRREFPGGEDLFNKIDTDGDGLISVEEAIKADTLIRKQP
jgi:Ca2+-binding EF-hand superfamily protein